MMKLKRLDRYLLSEFTAPLALVVLGLASLVWLTQLIDTLPRLRNAWNAPYSLIFVHHLFEFPYLITQVVPVGVMLASLISLGNLARNSELTALRAGGVSAWRIAIPIVSVALIGSLLLLVLSESMVPWASHKARYVQRVLIEKRSMIYDRPWRVNMAKSLSGGRQLFARQFDAPSGTFVNLVVLKRDGADIIERTDAQRAKYDFSTQTWTMHKGLEQTFDKEGRVLSSRPFESWPLNLSKVPDDFMVDTDRREEDLVKLSIPDLQEIIAVLKSTGADFRKELTCLHLRISYPFSCFILALLGVSIPFLFPSGRRSVVGAALGALIAISTSLSYLVFVQVGLSLGKSGFMAPIPAAWMANVVFLGLGMFALWKVNR